MKHFQRINVLYIMQSEKTIKQKVVNVSNSEIKLKLNTIVFLVGPSGAGKTFFVKNNLIPSLETVKGVGVSHISSDDIRRELIGDVNASKNDPRMSQVSKQAFMLLESKVRAFTTYPVNTDFVIVDTTGLNKDFRDSIKDIAAENNYHFVVVMFDYKGKEMYIKNLSDEESISVTHRQLKYMRETVLRDISKKNYKTIFKIKSHDFDSYKISISDHAELMDCVLPTGQEYVIIGDVHGCYDEFLDLIEKNGFVIDREKKKIIGCE